MTHPHANARTLFRSVPQKERPFATAVCGRNTLQKEVWTECGVIWRFGVEVEGRFVFVTMLRQLLPPLMLGLTLLAPPPRPPAAAAALAGTERRAARARALRLALFDEESEPLLPNVPEGPSSSSSSLAKPLNAYYEALTNISAPELVGGFAETAPPEVQQAVRSTIVSLLGNLPPQLYETNVVSSGQSIATHAHSPQHTTRNRTGELRPEHRLADVLDADDRLHVPQRRVPPEPAQYAREHLAAARR